MIALDEHPAVQRFRAHEAEQPTAPPGALDAGWLKNLCREAGADDAGLVEIGRSALDNQRADILRLLPGTKTLVSFVCRMNREPIRSASRSASNLEFHHGTDAVNAAAHTIVAALERRGIAAVNPSSGFPMEMDRFPGKIWDVSHKPVAVAAGLGQMGIHRNVIHPRFGNFVLLGTVLVAAEATAYDRPIDYNPCLECKLCVAACPTGAIAADGRFDFSACQTHNYREFMGGFVNWVEQVASSGAAQEYRRRVSDSETASMWQSLSFGANYKAAYCMAVCPAGDDVIGPFLADRAGFVEDVVRPLQHKPETVYVIAGSDAEEYVPRRFPGKTIKRVKNGLRPRSIRSFLASLPLVFQRGRAKGVNATCHFTFTGAEERQATIVVREGRVAVEDGLRGDADVRVTADARTWLGMLAGEKSLAWALLTRKIRIAGARRLLLKFPEWFPT